MVKTVRFNNDKSEIHNGAVIAEPIDLSPLLDIGLLLKTIFRYSSAEDLVCFRRASSCFHPHIQTFWYRFDPWQQMYYLTKYALEILAKKHRPFQLQKIKQALHDGVSAHGVWLFSVTQMVSWLIGCLLPEAQDCPLPQIENPFLSAMLNLFRHQYYGNETFCQKSYHQALEHIDAMSEPMELLLKVLVLSVFYKPGDLINAFKNQRKQKKKNLFWNFDEVVTNCGEKKLPAVVRVLQRSFKHQFWRVRRAVSHAWIQIPLYYPSYSKNAWAKPLYLRLIDRTPYMSPSVIYASVDIAKYCNKRQFSNLLAAVVCLFDDEHFDVGKAAIDTSVNLVQYCNKRQFVDLTNGLFLRLKDTNSDIGCAAIDALIEIAKTNPKQGWGWINPLYLLFKAKNKDVLLTIIRAAVQIAKYCNKHRFTELTSGLLPRLKDVRDDIRHAALHAWIEIAETNSKQGWGGWINPLYLLFTAENNDIRSSAVEFSVDMAKLCNQSQQTDLLLALRVCLRDECSYIRLKAVQSWVEIAKNDPNRQCDEWIKPLHLLLLDEDDSIFRSLVEGFPEIAKYCDEKQFDNLIIKRLLNVHLLIGQEEFVRLSEKITRHCKKKHFSTLMRSLFLSAKNKYDGMCCQAILILGGMAKHCEKTQFASLISKLFAWMSANSCKDYDDDLDDDKNYFKAERREAIVCVFGEIAKYCDKKQFSSMLKIACSHLGAPVSSVRERTFSALVKLKKYCDKKQVVELTTALVRGLSGGHGRIRSARTDALDAIVGYNDESSSFGLSLIFRYYLGHHYENNCYDLSARKAAIQICIGRTKDCDKKQFLALMMILLSELKKTGSDRTARIINTIAKRASADQRKEMMHALVKGEAIDLNLIPIIQAVVFLDSLSGRAIEKKWYQRLIQLKIIQERPNFKQEKQADFKAALDDLKKSNGNAETKKEAEALYGVFLSRSSALTTIENRPKFLMSFFLLKLEAFALFAKLTSSPSEKKAIESKAETCAAFFCRYQTRSMIIQVAKSLPHQPFACQKAIKTLINGYLPRRVYGFRERIRPNPRYSTKVSVARSAIFSQSNKKRRARAAGMANQSNVVNKHPRQ
jgi:hypothetical protein